MTAQKMLFFRPHKFFVEIGQDLRGVFFTSVNDVWFWSCFYCNLWNTAWYMQLDTRWCIVFLTSYTSDICMGLIGNTCFKGTPGVLKHYSGLPMANPGGPLNYHPDYPEGHLKDSVCTFCLINSPNYYLLPGYRKVVFVEIFILIFYEERQLNTIIQV